jgi:sugar phosphate isomerase/epimerase
MRFGVADYGMNVWDGGLLDLEERLSRLKAIGYEGVERLEASDTAQLVDRAVTFRRLGCAWGTCRGPNAELSHRWAAAMGCAYVWAAAPARDLPTFCRQVNAQVAACARLGLRVGLHNHMGTPVETPGQLAEFMALCPDAGLILDTAHLAAAGGDPLEALEAYGDRLVAVHLKDWEVTNPDLGLARWTEWGRFCGLGRGSIGMDNAAVLRRLVAMRYDGWVFVEHDTHLRDPFLDLADSRRFIADALA